MRPIHCVVLWLGGPSGPTVARSLVAVPPAPHPDATPPARGDTHTTPLGQGTADKSLYFLRDSMDGERPGWLQARPHPNAAILSSSHVWGGGPDLRGALSGAHFRDSGILRVHFPMLIAVGLPACCLLLYGLFVRGLALGKDGMEKGLAQRQPPPPQAGEEGDGASQDGACVWRLLCMIGPLWPSLLATALGSSIAGTSEQYITLNWFASQHDTGAASGPARCDTNNLDPRCQAGISDNLSVTTALSMITPVAHFLLGPGLGALSDSWGRRPIFVACKVVFMAPVAAMAAHVYLGVSLVYYLALCPLGDIPAYVVHYAYITDRIPDPSTLMAAFALMGAASRVFMLLGMLVGSFLSMKGAYTLSLALQGLAFLYTVLLLPESLPREKRKELRGKSLYPVLGLGILFRNDALRRLTFIITLSSFVDAGFSRVMPSYMMKYLPWDMSAQYWANITFSASVVAWLSAGVWWLRPWLGDVGMLFVGRLCTIFWGIPQMMSTRAWHIWAVNGMFAGPTSLTMPVIASMKSKLVPNDEQGRMQGALATVTDLAAVLGPMLLCPIFNATNKGPAKTASSNFCIYVCILASLPILAVVASLPAALGRCRVDKPP